MSEFWESLLGGYYKESNHTSSLDSYLGGNSLDSDHYNSMKALTDRQKEAEAVSLPVSPGTRVSFITNVGSVLTYPNPPDPNSVGTVVTVRSANGDTTAHNEMVFVQWDGGNFLPVHRMHLKAAVRNQKRASSVVMKVSNLGDLGAFFSPSKRSKNDLVRKSTKDLWSLQKDGDQYVLSRLFNESGDPLKVG